MIYIEGARNVGKTYLLNKYLTQNPNRFFVYKFPFFDYYKELDLEKGLNAGTYFGYGKDLDLLALAKANLLPKNLIMDRGFVSNVVFAMIFRKAKEADMEHYLSVIKTKFPEVRIDIIYVEADENGRFENHVANYREKDEKEISALNITNSDIFKSTYNFKYSWALELLENTPNINIHKITNHFDDASIEEFNTLINSLYQ